MLVSSSSGEVSHFNRASRTFTHERSSGPRAVRQTRPQKPARDDMVASQTLQGDSVFVAGPGLLLHLAPFACHGAASDTCHRPSLN